MEKTVYTGFVRILENLESPGKRTLVLESVSFGQAKVMQQVGCITIFLCSMVATCESNENGRFSTQLGLAKPSLEGKSVKCN